jgi:hypothetical protein
MNKIKIIDLLNKIANGEEVPKKIKYTKRIGEYLILGLKENDYIDIDGDCLFEDYDWLNNLNEEVEIIKDKKIEKIEQRTDAGLIGTDSVDMIEHTNRINRQAGYLSEIVSKINEIIDYINKGDK